MAFLTSPRSWAALLFGILCGGPALAVDLVGDLHPEPVTRRAEITRVAVPCDQARAEITLAAGETVAFADTTSGDGVVDGYACRDWSEAGPEHIYLLEVVEELNLDIWLADNDPDLDLALLTDCDSDSCLVQANTQISGRLEAGDYVLVVDGYEAVPGEGGVAGPYELTIETRAVGVPAEVCAPGTAADLGEFAGTVPPVQIDGNLFGQPNLISVYDCAPLAARGGEQWFTASLAASDTTYDDGTDLATIRLTFSVSADSLDTVIWAFDGCGPDASCLAFADDGPAGTVEELVYQNDLEEPVTLYLAVDSVQPAERESQGTFQVSTEGAVPVERRTLGDIRSLFR
ncbi:hypothetical protein GF314_08370 [bacterium]|nr:hypothetical protein [bacterium]